MGLPLNIQRDILTNSIHRYSCKGQHFNCYTSIHYSPWRTLRWQGLTECAWKKTWKSMDRR